METINPLSKRIIYRLLVSDADIREITISKTTLRMRKEYYEIDRLINQVLYLKHLHNKAAREQDLSRLEEIKGEFAKIEKEADSLDFDQRRLDLAVAICRANGVPESDELCSSIWWMDNVDIDEMNNFLAVAIKKDETSERVKKNTVDLNQKPPTMKTDSSQL